MNESLSIFCILSSSPLSQTIDSAEADCGQMEANIILHAVIGSKRNYNVQVFNVNII
jgi:hypothetical protein